MSNSSLVSEMDVNVAFASEGSPVTLKVTVWLKPPRLVIEIVLAPPCPGALIVIVDGLAAIEKSSTLSVCAADVEATKFVPPL